MQRSRCAAQGAVGGGHAAGCANSANPGQQENLCSQREQPSRLASRQALQPAQSKGVQEVVDEPDTLVFVLIDEVESLTAARWAFGKRIAARAQRHGCGLGMLARCSKVAAAVPAPLCSPSAGLQCSSQCCCSLAREAKPNSHNPHRLPSTGRAPWGALSRRTPSVPLTPCSHAWTS